MTDNIINQNWDSFEDKVTNSDDGIAQLERWYKKNGCEIFHHIKDTEDDKDVMPIPIVGYGITAFLSDDNVASFRRSLNPKLGINFGVGVEKFFERYFNDRFLIIKQRNRESTPFEDERKTDLELLKEHLKEEEQLFTKSNLFFSEIAENEIKIVETIKKASLKYQEWLKEKLLELTKEETGQEEAESKDEEILTPNYSSLLYALRAYIDGINSIEFKNIVEHHSLSLGTPKAKWIGKPVDAHRFATYLKMSLPKWGNCFEMIGGRKLKHNDKDKFEKGSQINNILKIHLNK